MIRVLKDLRLRFGPARDQGGRLTCLAFAISDSHAASRPPYEPLSVEYLYRKAIGYDSSLNPHTGISLSSAKKALAADGQPVEADWPYLDALPVDLTTWTAPQGVQVHRRSLIIISLTFADICTYLEQDITPVLVMMLSEAFYRPDPEGIIISASNDPDTTLHAVVAVGHGTSSGERLVLVRNSWGKDWGLAGHVWLPEQYLMPRLRNSVLLNRLYRALFLDEGRLCPTR